MTDSEETANPSGTKMAPLKQLFKRQSSANLNGGGGGGSHQEEPSTDTSYHSSFPKKALAVHNHQQIEQQTASNSSSNYSSSPHSIVDNNTDTTNNNNPASFNLPQIEFDDDESFMPMDFLKKDAPLPPLPAGEGVTAVRGAQQQERRELYTKPQPQYLTTSLNDVNDDDDDDDDNSIQASPVVYEPEPKEKQKFSYQSSSSTLPSHFSNNSSASSSTTVDSVSNPTNNHGGIKHVHTNSAISYQTSNDAETARQFWTYHHHTKQSSVTSYEGAAGVAEEADEDEDDEPLFDDKLQPPKSRVKSMFPNLSFYKPLKNPDEEYKQEEAEDGEDEGLVAPQNNSNAGLYDGATNDSALSFNESSQTEQELEKKSSLPPVDTNLSSSFRRSIASPVKQLGNRLAKRSSRTFSKKLVFNESDQQNQDASSPPPGPIPPMSIDGRSFAKEFGSDEDDNNCYYRDEDDDDEETDGRHKDQENAPPGPSPISKRAPPPPQAPLPPHLTIRANSGQESDEDDDEEDNLLPLSPLAPPTRSVSSSQRPGPSTTNRVMTKSQFDSYRKSMIESGLTSPLNHNEKDGNGDSDGDDGMDEEREEDDEDEDNDDKDRYDDDRDDKKQSIRMRLKQDAHLSVYRQKMTKVTGSQTALSSYNPGVRSSQSFGNIDSMMMEDDDEDDYDDVPLGILQAHGFPAGGGNGGQKLKTMSSQPNLNQYDELGTGTGPGMLYQGKAPADTQSLRSMNSANLKPGVDIRANAPALPSAFNNPTNAHMNRGLIGEIAIAEEAKQRRKSVGGMLNQRASSVFPSSQSVQGLSSTAQQNDPMQQQMQQMMAMQMRILEQMSGNSPQATPTMSGNSPGMKARWSSFDIPTQQQQSPSFPQQGRPSSIRSFTPSERSGQQPQSRPMSMMQLNQQQRSSFQPGHNRNSSQPTLKELSNQEMRMSRRVQSSPFMHSYPSSPNVQQSPQSPQQPRPASMMRLVQHPEEEEDDDDDDDDEAWEEMLRKRQGLKQSWKNRGITA